MIREEHSFLKELAAGEVPVVPPLSFGGQTLFKTGEIPFALFPKKGGRALDEFDQEGWETIGRLIARSHQIGALRAGSTRITWRPAIATRHHLEVLNQTEYILPEFKPGFNQAAEAFIAKADPLFRGEEFILIHGDLHKGNLIHRPNEGIFIVDFDDLCVGPAIQDVWMLLPGRPEQCEQELAWLIKGYQTFRPFDRSGLRLAPLLRGMRVIHYAAWLAIQSKEPDFGRNFPEAGNPRYWNELTRELHKLIYEEEQ